MSSSEGFFSPDYFEARRRFCENSKIAGGRLETLPLKATGPNGEALGIEIAWFGNTGPRRAVLHSCGLHGVEGFAGSAIQIQLLSAVPEIPEDTALIMIHVLNPYGMAWLRRFNENNVDLNRNFLGGEPYAGAPAAYSMLDSFLNPQTAPSRDLYKLRVGWLVLRYGTRALTVAVTNGQYEYPKGLFFGGRLLQEEGEKYAAFLTQRLASVEQLVAIDVHTGLGNYGKDILVAGSEHHSLLRTVFGERVVVDSHPVRGALQTMISRTMPQARVLSVLQEFGTYNPMKVLYALREENRWHHYGAGTLDHAVKRSLKETFAPKDETWRLAVLKRGQELLQQGLSVPL